MTLWNSILPLLLTGSHVLHATQTQIQFDHVSSPSHLRPNPTNLQPIPPDTLQTLSNNTRSLSWWSHGDNSAAYTNEFFFDSSREINQWAQAYRMLGAFIDCDHFTDQSGDSGDGSVQGCSRWMMWAAYYNPNYNGGGYAEYFDDGYGYGYNNYYTNDTGQKSSLDCHNPNSDWQLIGVYRQEFYQFVEQISKHMWAIDDYEYVVALAGLAYMTDADCWETGYYDEDGNSISAGVQPLAGGQFQMALYTDGLCVTPNTNLQWTFDDLGLTSNMDLDNDGDDYTLYTYWQAAQESTLTLMNEIYEEFQFCNLCIDYPSYQDGYEEDDLISQCWKFYSHGNYVCESDCLAKGDAQGTIAEVRYGNEYFGTKWTGSSGSWKDVTSVNTSVQKQSGANDFLGISTMVFLFMACLTWNFRETERSRKRQLNNNLLDDYVVEELRDPPITKVKSPHTPPRNTLGGSSDISLKVPAHTPTSSSRSTPKRKNTSKLSKGVNKRPERQGRKSWGKRANKKAVRA